MIQHKCSSLLVIWICLTIVTKEYKKWLHMDQTLPALSDNEMGSIHIDDDNKWKVK